ncbi:hypothetical protein ACR77J_17565 [Tissierella praeacuta]
MYISPKISLLSIHQIIIVDVRRLRENKGKEVAEIAKYTVKA